MSFFENLNFNPLDFWAVGAIVLVLLLWGILALFGHRFRGWVVPTFCSIAILANASTYFLLEGSPDLILTSEMEYSIQFMVDDEYCGDVIETANENNNNQDGNDEYTTGPFEVIVTENNSLWGAAHASVVVAERGNRINLTAEPIEGYEFDRWEVVAGGITLNNAFSPYASFTMPNNGVSLVAHFRMEGIPVHSIAVDANNPAYGVANADRPAAQVGQRVLLFAIANARYEFEQWEVVGGDITIIDIYSASSYFMMPDSDVSIRANFIPAPDVPPQPEQLGDFVLPESSSRFLTDADVSHLVAAELRIARNEIFARHGRMFNSRDLQEHFEARAWYNGHITPGAFSYDLLNQYEKANILLIQEWEERRR